MAKTVIRSGIIHLSRPRSFATSLPIRLDRPGFHGDAEEASDHDDEEGDVDGPKERPAVVVVDVPRLVLDPVEPVDRSGDRVDEDPLRVRLHLVVGARDRLALFGEVVVAGGDDPGGDGGEDDGANRIV